MTRPRRKFDAPTPPPALTREQAETLLATLKANPTQNQRTKLFDGMQRMAYSLVGKALQRWNLDAEETWLLALETLWEAVCRVHTIDHANAYGFLKARVWGAICDDLAKPKLPARALTPNDDERADPRAEQALDDVDFWDEIQGVAKLFPLQWRVEQLCRDLADGHTLRDLAEAYDVPRSTLHNRLQAIGEVIENRGNLTRQSGTNRPVFPYL